MNDGQVKQIVDAIREHTRAMVAGMLWAGAATDTEANVVVAAALRIAELEAQVRERDGLLRQVLDPDDCRLDHHGFCQTHGWMDRSGCPHARIRSLIGAAKCAP